MALLETISKNKIQIDIFVNKWNFKATKNMIYMI